MGPAFRLGVAAALASALAVPLTAAATPAGRAAAKQPLVRTMASDGISVCALLAAGTVYCWGRGSVGSLGDGSTANVDTAHQVLMDPGAPAPLTGATFLASDATEQSGPENSYCAVRGTHTVWCWGANTLHQLGNGNSAASEDIATEVKTSPGQPLQGAVKVTMNYGSACALTTAHTVYCWGDDQDGELGNNTVATASAFAVQVLTSASGNPPLGGVAQVVGDANEAYCALLSSGGVACWGDNATGELGLGTVGGGPPACVVCIPVAGPVLLPAGVSATALAGESDYVNPSVAVPYGFFCAATTGGSSPAYCWGENNDAALGDSSITDTGVTCVPSGPVYCEPAPVPVTFPGTLPPSTTATRIEPGPSNSASMDGTTSCAELSNSSLWCWGENDAGELGIGTATGPDICASFSTTACSWAAVQVTDASLNPVGAVAFLVESEDVWCAALAPSGADCWGLVPGGPYYATPVHKAATGNPPLPRVVTLEDTAFLAECFGLAAGGVQCMGDEFDGMLGNGSMANTTLSQTVPVQGLP